MNLLSCTVAAIGSMALLFKKQEENVYVNSQTDYGR